MELVSSAVSTLVETAIASDDAQASEGFAGHIVAATIETKTEDYLPNPAPAVLISIDPNTGKTTPLFPHDHVVYQVPVLLTAEGLPSSAYQTQLGLAKRNRALKPVRDLR